MFFGSLIRDGLFRLFFFCERSGWNWSIVDEILPCLVEILDRDRTQIGPRQKWFFLWLLFCSAFIPLSLANLPLVTTSRSRSTCRRLWWWSIELHSAHMTDLYTHTRPFLSHWTVCKSFSLFFHIPKGLFIQRIPFRSNNVTRWPFKTIFQISAPFLVLVFFFLLLFRIDWLRLFVRLVSRLVENGDEMKTAKRSPAQQQLIAVREVKRNIICPPDEMSRSSHHWGWWWWTDRDCIGCAEKTHDDDRA